MAESDEHAFERPAAPISDPDGPGLSHHIPAQRQHLANTLRRLATDPSAYVSTAALPVADVMLSDACTACGLCAKYCPTEAISFISDDEYYVLNFAAALCLGAECSLCIIGCPTDAVSFGQQVTIDELLSTQLRPIRAGRLTACTGCGAPVHSPIETDETAEAPLCHICRDRVSRPGPMDRIAKR